jgi:hypothetical protein
MHDLGTTQEAVMPAVRVRYMVDDIDASVAFYAARGASSPHHFFGGASTPENACT